MIFTIRVRFQVSETGLSCRHQHHNFSTDFSKAVPCCSSLFMHLWFHMWHFVFSLLIPLFSCFWCPERLCFVIVALPWFLHLCLSQRMKKTYDKIVLPAKTGQSVHPPSMTWVLVYLFLDRLEAVEGICVQQRLTRLLGCTG